MAGSKTFLLLAMLSVAVGTGKAASTCQEYPYGWGYDNLGNIYTAVKNCLAQEHITNEKCSLLAVTSMITATEHEQFANSDRRKVIPFVVGCLKSAKANQASINKAETCMLNALVHYNG